MEQQHCQAAVFKVEVLAAQQSASLAAAGTAEHVLLVVPSLAAAGTAVEESIKVEVLAAQQSVAVQQVAALRSE